MKKPFVSLALFLGLSFFLQAAEPGKDFFFQPKDRIIFLGDSITEQYQYSNAIEVYLTNRFPGADFFFLNAGIGGIQPTVGPTASKATFWMKSPTR